MSNKQSTITQSTMPSDYTFTDAERQQLHLAIREETEAPYRKLEKILKRVKPALATSIREHIEDVQLIAAEVTTTPNGKKQKEPGYRFRHIFHHGTYDSNFDCGAGTVSIGIGNGNYLTYKYCI
ncbi:hypothetical protein [Photobacterium ganghwense]|uniref:hypothetical protein n=1 Tax=Photobacterium ganghwense TaxID=320778 RepID=UPI001A8E850F|nr:hypothetical protein [Photobacterium ganghwense]QSV17555.1 hypothetical protein FH974_25975 [Photobacterium ganghwense]